MSEVRERSAERAAKTIELIVVIMLGVTAVLTAWASWESSLHGGNQATNYTTSNNLSAMGNSSWTEASASLQSDMSLYNEINGLRIDLTFAEDNGNQDEAARIQWKLNELLNNNASDELIAAINWADAQEEYASPFEMEGYVDSYYTEARDYLDQSQEALEQGRKDNANGDRLGLVTVIYSVVLFLLGITGTLKSQRNQKVIIGISCVCFLAATVLMCCIPLPTGFSLASMFAGA